MATRSLIRGSDLLPSAWSDFFTPWNEWFNTPNMVPANMKMPAVNIAETKDAYEVRMAVPGLKKEDFSIDLAGNMLTISCEKETESDEEKENYTRREFSYTSFSRSFTLPDEVNMEKINAVYEDGILKLNVPKRDEAKKEPANKHIAVQ